MNIVRPSRYPYVMPHLIALAREHLDKRFGIRHVKNPSEQYIALMQRERQYILTHGDDAACRYGPMTWEVAKRYGQPIDTTRRHLVCALETGRALADGRGGGRGIRWWPVGLAEQLLAEDAASA